MAYLPFFLQRLDLDPDADERSIRRAYARELKQIDQAADAAGFQILREAYEAALVWARRRQQSDTEADSVPDTDSEPTAPAITTSAAQAVTIDAKTTTTEAVPASALSIMPEPAPPAPTIIDDRQLAHDVFVAFAKRIPLLAAGPDGDYAPWRQALRDSLADSRLDSLAARDDFEQRLAHLLASGWQPGHEALLAASIDVFDWAGDRRRVAYLGAPGALLNAAIDQRASFAIQPDAVRQRQHRLIRRLRDPRPPRTGELVRNADTLATLIARFPDWLALIASVSTIVHWRELEQAIPPWRRKLVFTSVRKPAAPSPGYGQDQSARGGYNWIWLVILLLSGVARFASHAGDSATPPPALTALVTEAVNQGHERINQGDSAGAVAAYSRALQLDPTNPRLLAYRAMAYFWNEQYVEAASDAKRVKPDGSGNPVLHRVRGLLALHGGRPPDALADFTRAIELEPGHAWTYTRRALAYEAAGQLEPALADARQSVRLASTDNAHGYYVLSRLQKQQGHPEQALETAAALVAADGHNAIAYLVAANIHMLLGPEQRQRALAILDRGIETAPDARLQLRRAELLPPTDIAGMRAAMIAALALKPHDSLALRMRADLELQTHNYRAALDAHAAALAEEPTDSPYRIDLMLARGVVYSRLGRASEAASEIAAAHASIRTAMQMNNACWRLATENVALKTALDDCDGALARDPGKSIFLDSKAMVLLRLKRYREALAAYNAALAQQPDLAMSRYARGIVRRRLGDAAGGDTDIRAALAADAGVGAKLARFGIAP